MAVERLQKILAHGGIASRRAAEDLITQGRVRINGRVVRELGTKADTHVDKIELDGRRVVAEQPVYVALHKPRGMVSTMSDPENRPTVAELLNALGARVYPVGRLDFATSGILLATNDGDFANGLLHPKKRVPKTYVLKVMGHMEDGDLENWRRGIKLEDGPTLPAQVKLIRHEAGKTWLEMTIQEGRNQQIRRMGEASGFPVMRLARTVFAGVSSEGLAPGRLRYLTRDELTALKKEYGVPKRVTFNAGEAETGRPSRAKPHAGAPGKTDSRRERSHAGGARSPRFERRRDGDEAPSAGERAPAAGRGGTTSRSAPSDRGPRSRAASTDDRSNGSRPAQGKGDRRSRAPETERAAPPSRGRAPSGPSAAGREERPQRGKGAKPASGAPSTRGRSGGGGGEYRYSATEAESPRLGGGAPGRRGYDVNEDWGGGAGRGSSGTRDDAPADSPPGRGGRSRTTGTGGGIGAGSGDYRISKGRKR